MLGGIGKDAGETAARELHAAIDGAIPEAQKAGDELVSRISAEIVTQLTGALTQAAGAACLALGSLPESILDALDGLKVEISAVTVKVSRRQTS